MTEEQACYPSTRATSEEELRWILSRFWNIGTERYTQQDYTLSIQLCSVAMEFLQTLSPASQETLQPKMMEGFQTINDADNRMLM
jgi:hypothetical protein